MKRKIIIAALVLLAAAASTIVVRADLFSSRQARASKTQVDPSNASVISAVVSSYLNTREEGTYLVLEGGVFLVLGVLWLRRARREQYLVDSKTPDGAD